MILLAVNYNLVKKKSKHFSLKFKYCPTPSYRAPRPKKKIIVVYKKATTIQQP